MRKKISVRELPEFDIAEQLKDDDEIAAYLTMVITEGDLAEVAHALSIVARNTAIRTQDSITTDRV